MNDASATSPETPGRAAWFFDILGILGFLLAVPACLVVLGKPEEGRALERALGPFASPGALLLGCAALELAAGLFGSGSHALPIFAGLTTGLALFGGAFDLPFLGFLRTSIGRLPGFARPGPPLAAGLSAILSGQVLGAVKRGRSGVKSLAVIAAAFTIFVTLGTINPFPEADRASLSVETALKSIAAELGREYRSPEVEAAVRKVMEDSKATEAEKDGRIAELTERLRRSEEDAAALLKAARDGKALSKELEESRKALEELRAKLDKEEPLLPGKDYARAVQPRDPAVRDYAVRLASGSPGPFDEPQGSRLPTDTGLGQAYRIHAALSSSWKYVSDPAVSWSDYASPARRTLALGLAGDCDDFAILVASCVQAVGGRTRIVHGYTDRSGHAWAELWMGDGERGRAALARAGRAAGRPGWTPAHSTDGRGGTWLVLDWRFGELSMRPSRTEAAWTGD